MRILPRKAPTTEPNDAILPWLPSAAAVSTAARRLGCEPGTSRNVLGELHATTDHLWPTTARAAVRPPCRILEASRNDVTHNFVTVAVPTVAERLAAIGLVYAARAVTS